MLTETYDLYQTQRELWEHMKKLWPHCSEPGNEVALMVPLIFASVYW